MANQLVFFGLALGRNQGENRVAVRRRNRHPTATGLITLVNHQTKSQLVHVESQTSILIANEDVDAEDAKIWVLPIHTRSVPLPPIR
jgi:hypothetical protein